MLFPTTALMVGPRFHRPTRHTLTHPHLTSSSSSSFTQPTFTSADYTPIDYTPIDYTPNECTLNDFTLNDDTPTRIHASLSINTDIIRHLASHRGATLSLISLRAKFSHKHLAPRIHVFPKGPSRPEHMFLNVGQRPVETIV